jgi:rubrerythrin
MGMQMDRGEFFSASAKGGLALVAGGGILATAAAPAAAQGSGDRRILALAATAELLVIDFLRRALAADINAPRDVLREERTHLRTIRSVLGRSAPDDVDPTFPAGTFDSAESVARLGFTLDTAFTRFYIGAVPRLRTDRLRTLAASLAANEAQHLSAWSIILERGPIPLPAIPKGISPSAAQNALAPLLAGVPDGTQMTG